MASAFEWANALAIRAAGVAPQWVQQVVTNRTSENFPGYAVAPAPGTDSLGVSVDGSLVTGLDFRTRENPAITRTIRISATTFEGDGTYTLTVCGDPFVAGPDTYADAEEMLQELLDELLADGRLDTSEIEGTGNTAILVVRNTELGGPYDVSFDIGIGTDVFVVTADCVSAVLKFYGINRGALSPGYWNFIADSEYSLTDEGLTGPLLDTSQASRLYCFADCTGDPSDGAEVVPVAFLFFGPSFALTSEI